MSGGHFDYHQYQIQEIADSIEKDIARALQPKPQKVHEDFWTINMHDRPYCSHSYCSYQEFETYEEAEEFLLLHKMVVPSESNYGVVHISAEDKIFQSTDLYMKGTKDDELIPILYTIHHAVFDHYPYDADVLELNDETIATMKEAYLQIRKAYIYAQRVDWMMSGDDGEDDLQERLKVDLDELQKEYDNKDWACPYEGWDEDD